MTTKIDIPYIGGVLSDNAYKNTNHHTVRAVRNWMNLLALKVENANVVSADRYVVGVRGFFTDERRPDIPNLFKVTLDAVKVGLKRDDKYFIARDDGYEIGYVVPFLRITIEETSK